MASRRSTKGTSQVKILNHDEPRNSFRDDLIPTLNCPNSGQFLIAPAPILALCRELLAAGIAPDAAVELYRRMVRQS
jgi:hypothetical protein